MPCVKKESVRACLTSCGSPHHGSMKNGFCNIFEENLQIYYSDQVALTGQELPSSHSCRRLHLEAVLVPHAMYM